MPFFFLVFLLHKLLKMRFRSRPEAVGQHTLRTFVLRVWRMPQKFGKLQYVSRLTARESFIHLNLSASLTGLSAHESFTYKYTFETRFTGNLTIDQKLHKVPTHRNVNSAQTERIHNAMMSRHNLTQTIHAVVFFAEVGTGYSMF